jgi:uncharacterized protein YecE (DUF72 family)
VGTSSWTDPGYLEDWYPEGLRPAELLPWYAKHFRLVEVNSTFYAIPSRETVQGWVERTPPGFIFDVKLPRLLSWHSVPHKTLPSEIRRQVRPNARGTVERTPRLVTTMIMDLRRTLEPLLDSGKFGAFLLQLSPSFSPRRHKLTDLDSVLTRLPGITAVEFRNRSWVAEEQLEATLEYLRARDAVFVSIDGPRAEHFMVMPSIWATTNSQLAYVRCHGRNAQGYIRGRTVADRFNYDYPLKEIKQVKERAETLAEEAAEVHVLFNNNRSNYAPKAAARLKRLLSQPG